MSAETEGTPTISGMATIEGTTKRAETNTREKKECQQHQEATEHHTTAWILITEERPVTAGKQATERTSGKSCQGDKQLRGLNVSLTLHCRQTCHRAVDTCGKSPANHPNICHRCQQHRWQIMATISNCFHFEVCIKNYLNVNYSKMPKQNIYPPPSIDDFFHLPPVSLIPEVHLYCSCEYFREFSLKIEITPIL